MYTVGTDNVGLGVELGVGLGVRLGLESGMGQGMESSMEPGMEPCMELGEGIVLSGRALALGCAYFKDVLAIPSVQFIENNNYISSYFHVA